jgi:hypothetical protein
MAPTTSLRGRRAVTLACTVAAAACAGARGASGTAPDEVARAVEVDHVFLATRPGAPEAAALRAAGLRVGDRTTRHTGNGTASIVVLFDNAYLELLYPDSTVSDSASPPDDRAHWRRVFAWRESGASPIGVGLRRTPDAPDSLPFATERMPPAPWMPPGTDMRIVTTNADSLAPGVFVVPRQMAVPTWIDRMRRDTASAALLQHPLGVRRVTGVRVVVARADAVPPSVRRLHDAGVLRVERGPAPLLELTFDGARRGAARDLRPELPLVLRY